MMLGPRLNGSDFWNDLSREAVPTFVRYSPAPISYNRNMIYKPFNDWFLQAWLDSRQMKDVDLRRATGWSKRKVSELINGSQRYNRDVVNEAAFALQISPWELLLHPEDANEIKQLLSASEKRAIRLAHQSKSEQEQSEAPDPMDQSTHRRQAG